MAMEVVIPTMDFDFNSARPFPYNSAPSTPKRFGEYYFSVPNSPTQISEFYRDFDDFCVASSSSSSVPFDWEEKPGTPKSPKSKPSYEDEFAFDVGVETTLSAEELFDGGKIRPLKPPPSRLGESRNTPKKTEPKKKTEHHERGRERNPSLSSSNSGRRATRSQSPRRLSKHPWEEEAKQFSSSSSIVPSKPSATNSTLSPSSSKGGSSSRKWWLKDFFLFRSASEGRAADKDPLKKYSGLFRKQEDMVKSSSFRSIEGGGGGGSSSKRRAQVSAHELHYTMNKAVSEDLRKKTFLPYKQGILGRLAFNPAVHALANGFGFSKK